MGLTDHPSSVRAQVDRRRLDFQGRRSGKSAFSLVNAHWSAGLERDYGLVVGDFDPTAESPDFLIHHDFETHFAAFQPPVGSRTIAVRTWDFGPLPTAWAEKINREFDHFWAYSHWIAKQAEAAGVDPARIRVVPLGIDPEVFRPDGVRYPLATARSFRFLFVGGVSARKGTDILLEAYRQAFSAADDVTLVIKDHSGDLFYKGDKIRGRVADFSSDPMAPHLVHLDQFLNLEDLAALYRACDVAVFPYRAEGFCLPILEAMACGTPPIVPDFGACLDFCSDDVAFLTPVRRIHLPVNNRFRVALGFEEEVGEVDFCEMERGTLAARMRDVFHGLRGERDRMAAAGVRRAHGAFTWTDSVARVGQCLAELGADQDRSSMVR